MKGSLLKNLSLGVSKHKKGMFSSRNNRSSKFGKKLKGSKSKFAGDMKSSSISPSTEEFDKMMNHISGKNTSSKKSMFSRKLD